MSSGSPSSWQRWEMGRLERRTIERGAKSKAPIRRREDQISMTLFDLAKEEATKKGFEKGMAEGFAQGYAEGEAKVRAEHEQALAAELAERVRPIGDLATAFRHAADNLDDQLAYQLVELAIETGRQLAGRALEIKPEHILDDIEELMETHAGLTGNPTLYVNMDDLALIESTLSQALAAAGWQLRADINLGRGDCRIETESAEIDASADDRWTRLLHAVGHGEH
ncbi:flagellar assembly protein FliH [Salinisphaera aquimarina]|uniref:Flagellar assembly protein FliH n=1 Tax=Salinisphaera aquimarina TaxID=2094031 RepID=A0ABV7EQS3_9GAMM